MKKIVSLFFRIGISAALLIFVFERVDRKSLFTIIKNADKTMLFLAAYIFFSNYILCLFRWEMLLKAVKIHLPLKRVVISFSGGVFFSLFLPSTIGGDLMRSVDLATHTQRPREVVATVLLDRLSGYVGLTILALISLLIGWPCVRDKSVFLSVGAITIVLVVILLTLFDKTTYSRVNRLLHSPNAGKIRDMVRDMHKELHLFRHHERIILNNVIVSILIQMVNPLTYFMLALSLGLKVSIIYFFIFMPIISAVTLLPISIGGLGLRDAITIFFFAQAGITKDLAFAMSLLNFSFILIFGAIGGIIYVLTIHHRRVQHHKAHPFHPAN